MRSRLEISNDIILFNKQSGIRFVKKIHIAFTTIIVIGVIFTSSIVIQPCVKWNFDVDAFSGKASGTWEPLPAIYCALGISEVSDETINEVKNVITEYQKIKEQTELKEAEKAKLFNETKVLEPLAEKNPSLVPILENRKANLEEIDNELGELSSELATVEVQYMKSVDSLNVVVASEEDNYKRFSKIQSLLGATIELDQKTYTWTDKVYITVVAPGANKDPNVKDMIGMHELTVETKSGNKLEYSLVEEKSDSGIFIGEITLTGFPFYDVNNDGKDDDASGKTYGSGPLDGHLETEAVDEIIITYEFDKDFYVVGSAIIRWNIGETMFVDDAYQVNELATIRVVDPDLNTHPDEMDLVKVRVSSTTYPDGIDIILQETNNASGIFEGLLKFTTEQKSSMNTLRVSFGDEITAKYIDKTLPKPYSVGETLEIESTSYVEETLMP